MEFSRPFLQVLTERPSDAMPVVQRSPAPGLGRQRKPVDSTASETAPGKIFVPQQPRTQQRIGTRKVPLSILGGAGPGIRPAPLTKPTRSVGSVRLVVPADQAGGGSTPRYGAGCERLPACGTDGSAGTLAGCARRCDAPQRAVPSCRIHGRAFLWRSTDATSLASAGPGRAASRAPMIESRREFSASTLAGRSAARFLVSRASSTRSKQLHERCLPQVRRGRNRFERFQGIAPCFLGCRRRSPHAPGTTPGGEGELPTGRGGLRMPAATASRGAFARFDLSDSSGEARGSPSPGGLLDPRSMPATSATVAARSFSPTNRLQRDPGGTAPGHRASKGTRRPPSNTVNL